MTHTRDDSCLLYINMTFRYLRQLYVVCKHLFQIAKYFGRGGKGKWLLRKKNENWGCGEKNEKEGKRGTGKRRKEKKKRGRGKGEDDFFYSCMTHTHDETSTSL